ncbi:MAG TPA: hypothetical protein VEV82_04485 [Actinomycetota bacterium]|nr:hypothetical protein [Actinomycetota bacterium]
MRKVSIWIVAAVVSSLSLIGFAAPAQAGTCPIDKLITTGSCWKSAAFSGGNRSSVEAYEPSPAWEHA